MSRDTPSLGRWQAERSVHTRAFTLIELMVSISIIALLIAILLPALKKTRQAAQAVQCLSNQRQIGIAMTAYANRYDGYSPTTYDSAVGGPEKYWSGRLFVDGYIDSKAVFRCPSWDNGGRFPRGIYGKITGRHDPAAEPRRDFINMSNFNLTSHNPRIVSYADHVLLGDSFAESNSSRQFYYIGGRGVSNKEVHLRHSQSANVLYLDMHASATRQAFFQDQWLPHRVRRE
jgi:prepilin-type N-terminal cleavage/methylation domain-containing protein/prepilin-type processing-associated H-X9-DG protein